MEKFREYEDVLRTRYIHLYGSSNCDTWMKREKNKLIILTATCFMLLGGLIYSDITSSKSEYSNVVFNKKGEIVSVMRPEKGEESFSFTTSVRVISDEEELEKEYYITIEPAGEEANSQSGNLLAEPQEKDTAEAQLKQMISGLNNSTEDLEVRLPQQLENGDEVVWMKADNTDPVVYILGTLAVLWLIYYSRFHTIAREEKRARESIIKELPEFINKLVLLINAGVILNTAFLKVVDDCDENRKKNSYFYKRISDIGYIVRETNASFYKEMYTFAKYSGVKELMRITNIMMDNINKGDDLSDKLRRENELLWFARKQQAEEKGRLAETKLTLPLMILLTVLIMVTISPALMEI